MPSFATLLLLLILPAWNVSISCVRNELLPLHVLDMIQGFHCCWPAAVSGLTIRRSYLIYVRIEKVFERMDAIVNYRGVLLFPSANIYEVVMLRMVVVEINETILATTGLFIGCRVSLIKVLLFFSFFVSFDFQLHELPEMVCRWFIHITTSENTFGIGKPSSSSSALVQWQFFPLLHILNSRVFYSSAISCWTVERNPFFPLSLSLHQRLFLPL